MYSGKKFLVNVSEEPTASNFRTEIFLWEEDESKIGAEKDRWVWP